MDNGGDKMKYCVIKNTTKIIDGSVNPIEIMLQNAQNAGFTESEVEILTEEEYRARVELEPKPIPPMTESERITLLEQATNDLVMTIMMGGM